MVFKLTTAQSDAITTKARLAAQADFALLAVDSTNGPLPVHREDVLLARQMYAPAIAISLTQTEKVSDPELLDLEELEARELLNKYRMHGDDATCLVDAPRAASTQGGVKRTSDFDIVFANLLQRPKILPATTATSVDAEFYVLTSEELFMRGVTRPPESGKYQMVLLGQLTEASITFPKKVSFGDNLAGTVDFAAPASVVEGERFVVLRDGHLAVAGVITRKNSSK
jgi:translation elongation factor EF-Tu-like GTPase